MQPSTSKPPQELVLERLRRDHTLLQKAIASLHVAYRDLGLRYHALSLSLREEMVPEHLYRQCSNAFTVQANGSMPEIIAHIDHLDELKNRINWALRSEDVQAAQDDMLIADDILERMEHELVALEFLVDKHCFIEMEIEAAGTRFEDKGLQLASERFETSHLLLRAWSLQLREARTALEIGFDDEDTVFNSIISTDEERIVPDEAREIDELNRGSSSTAPAGDDTPELMDRQRRFSGLDRPHSPWRDIPGFVHGRHGSVYSDNSSYSWDLVDAETANGPFADTVVVNGRTYRAV